MFTLTRSDGGFSDIEVNLFQMYFAEKYTQVLLTSEAHKSGGIHLHGVCEDKVKEVTSLTKRLVRLYARLEIPLIENVSIHIRKCHELGGALNYCLKECTRDKKPLLCLGWTFKDLQRKALEALKKLKDKDINAKYYFVNQRSANGLIIRYAKTAGLPIVNKASFIDVICAMAKDRYQFASVKMCQVYAEVMAELGDLEVLRDHYELMFANLR